MISLEAFIAKNPAQPVKAPALTVIAAPGIQLSSPVIAAVMTTAVIAKPSNINFEAFGWCRANAIKETEEAI